MAILVSATAMALGQDLASFERRVRLHKLDNGLQFILVERHAAPTVAFHTYVDAGSVDEVAGITGMAHLFEHLAFKGTKTVGTRDFAAEDAALKALDGLYERKKRLERRLASGRATPEDQAAMAAVAAEWEALSAKAQSYVVEGEFDKALERNGAQGLNATTGSDATRYFYSLPSNRIELWANLESDRFANPVIREFYKERDVVMEERRMRVDSNPIGRMLEQILGTAFQAHPYGYPGIGFMSDLQTMTRPEAEVFFKKYYNASNLVIAVVGDFDTEKLIPLLNQYFSRIPGGAKPEPVETVEPPQLGLKICEVEDASQSVVGLCFHKPSALHADEPIYQALAMILGGGRSSRLSTKLVKESQVAVDAGAFAGLPGNKYPNLFVVYAMVADGKTAEQAEAEIWAALEEIQKSPVSAEELQSVVARVKAGIVESLGDNTGLAANLAEAQAIHGDWREVFRSLQKIEAVTPEDIQRVAKAAFRRQNCTIGRVVPPREESKE